MNILGLKIGGHDTGAAIIYGTNVVAIAEERLCRVKHAPWTFPRLSIDYCLSAAGLTVDDLDLVVLDSTSKVRGKTGAEVFHEQTHGRFKGVRTLMIGHHDAHAATAFLCSPFTDASILVYDGNGDRVRTNLGVVASETETMYVGHDTQIIQVDKSLHVKESGRYPWTFGIGLLYANLCRHYLGLGFNNEGKMMGLAAYGDDSFLKAFPYERWVGKSAGRLVCNAQLIFKKHLATPARLQRESCRTTSFC